MKRQRKRNTDLALIMPLTVHDYFPPYPYTLSTYLADQTVSLLKLLRVYMYFAPAPLPNIIWNLVEELYAHAVIIFSLSSHTLKVTLLAVSCC